MWRCSMLVALISYLSMANKEFSNLGTFSSTFQKGGNLKVAEKLNVPTASCWNCQKAECLTEN